MRYSSRAKTLFGIFVATYLISGGWAQSAKASWFECLRGWRDTAPSWLDDHDLRDALEGELAVSSMDGDAKAREQCYKIWKDTVTPRKIGDVVWVKGTRVKIKRMLGAGGEGVVYLVDTFHGPRILKEFPDIKALGGSLGALSQFGLRMPVPKVEKVNRDTGQVIMTYVKGVTVSSIQNSPRLTERQKSRIMNKYYEERNLSGLNLRETDVVLSLEDGKFYVIDGR